MKYLLATAAVLALTSVSATGAERYQPDDPEGARVVWTRGQLWTRGQ
jgi:hypothetical protein